MKHYLDLVPLSARVHRRQSRMTRLCILLGVFLVEVMFGLADMYLQGMTEETRRQTGDWHCRFAVSDADAADLIAARPEVACAAWQGSLAAGSGVTLQGRPAAVCGLEPDAFARLYLGGCSSGRAPAAAGETALSEALAQATTVCPSRCAAMVNSLPSSPEPRSRIFFVIVGVFVVQR